MSKPFSLEQMLSIGGNRWQRNGMDRVYLNDWPDMIELDVSYYNTGNISSAVLEGEHISNTRAGKLLAAKVYWEDGKIFSTIPACAERARLNGPGIVHKLICAIEERVREAEATTC